MKFLKELGQIYWHASFYHDVLELATSGSQMPISADHKRTRPSTDSQRTGTTAVQVREQSGAENSSKVSGDRIHTLENAIYSLPLAIHDASTTSYVFNQPIVHDHSATSGAQTEVGTEFDADNDFFEHWLDDPGFFTSMFPSA